MNIFLTGGCGYKGTVLVPKLLAAGHTVGVLDTMWFGNFLESHPNLAVVKGDVRDIEAISLDGVDVVIHLSSVANDPCGDLDPKLTWEISALATMQLADKAVRCRVKQFIYASSGSVYGIKEEEQVTEDLELKPISEYNKTKMVSERIFLSYKDNIIIHCIRPATVCGFSQRMRLDLSVNMLTAQAIKNKKITVFGGNQVRPNINIKDMIRVYQHFVANRDIPSGCYNAGFENISILDIALLVKDKIPSEIIITESNDPRSYRLCSEKLEKTGFERSYSVEDAIKDMIAKFESGEIKDTPQSYTVDWMKKLNLH